MLPFLQTDEAQKIYCETSFEERWAPKYMPSDKVGVNFIAIPSDSDVARIERISTFVTVAR